MALKLKNNAVSILGGGITDTQTTIPLRTGDGALFPTLIVAGDWFPVTVVNSLGQAEVMKCTGRAGDQLTVVRGQEGTSARAYSAGDYIGLRLTAGAIADMSLYQARTPDIASAATITPDTVAGSSAHVTGNVQINAVTLTGGKWFLVIFDGSPILAHHATNHNLNNGGNNIQIAAGDKVLYYSDGTTVYGIYFPASSMKYLASRADAATVTLTSADAGKIIKLSGAATTTTLPAASAMRDGDTLTFVSTGNGNIVSRAGADTITVGASAVTSLTLNTGDSLTLECFAGAWYAIGGSAQLRFAGSGPIPRGTIMSFFQATAPTGWTQITDHDNKAIRIVSGAGGGSDGAIDFTTAFSSKAVTGTVGNHALTIAEMPAHSHTIDVSSNEAGFGMVTQGSGFIGTYSTNSVGSGNGHNHSFTGTAINLAVKYIDMIICRRD